MLFGSARVTVSENKLLLILLSLRLYTYLYHIYLNCKVEENTLTTLLTSQHQLEICHLLPLSSPFELDRLLSKILSSAYNPRILFNMPSRIGFKICPLVQLHQCKNIVPPTQYKQACNTLAASKENRLKLTGFQNVFEIHRENN